MASKNGIYVGSQIDDTELNTLADLEKFFTISIDGATSADFTPYGDGGIWEVHEGTSNAVITLVAKKKFHLAPGYINIGYWGDINNELNLEILIDNEQEYVFLSSDYGDNIYNELVYISYNKEFVPGTTLVIKATVGIGCLLGIPLVGIGYEEVAKEVKKIYVGVRTVTGGDEDITERKLYPRNKSTTAEDGYARFFDITDGSYSFTGASQNTSKWTATNLGVNSSTASTVLTAKYDMSYLSFGYAVSSESNYDKLTIKVNGTTIASAISGTHALKTWTGSLLEGQKLEFTYTKDGSNSATNETAHFSDLTISTIISGRPVSNKVARKVKKAYIGVPTKAVGWKAGAFLDTEKAFSHSVNQVGANEPIVIFKELFNNKINFSYQKATPKLTCIADKVTFNDLFGYGDLEGMGQVFSGGNFDIYKGVVTLNRKVVLIGKERGIGTGIPGGDLPTMEIEGQFPSVIYKGDVIEFWIGQEPPALGEILEPRETPVEIFEDMWIELKKLQWTPYEKVTITKNLARLCYDDRVTVTFSSKLPEGFQFPEEVATQKVEKGGTAIMPEFPTHIEVSGGFYSADMGYIVGERYFIPIAGMEFTDITKDTLIELEYRRISTGGGGGDS